jgi:hypothetical protein
LDLTAFPINQYPALYRMNANALQRHLRKTFASLLLAVVGSGEPNGAGAKHGFFENGGQGIGFS